MVAAIVLVVNVSCVTVRPAGTALQPTPASTMVGGTTTAARPVLSTPSIAEATQTAGIPEVVEMIPTWPVPTSVPDQYAIHLQVGTIDTRVGEPPLPDALRIDGYQHWEDGYYIVQFVDVILPEWRGRLDDIGVVRLGSVPNNAFLVRMTYAQRATVAALDVVQWVGIYQPAYKLSPELPVSLEGRSTVTVLTFPEADVAHIRAQLQAWGGTIEASSENEFGGKVRVTVNLRFVVPIARLNDVMWLEPWIEPELGI
jgi:hypothetical protein